MVVRVQAQDQSWVWLYMVLQLQPGEIPISSNNYIIRYLSPFFQLHTSHPSGDKTLINGQKLRPNSVFLSVVSSLSVSLRPGQCVSSSAQSRPS